MTIEEFKKKMEELKANNEEKTEEKPEEKPKTVDMEKFKNSPFYLKFKEHLEKLKKGGKE